MDLLALTRQWCFDEQSFGKLTAIMDVVLVPDHLILLIDDLESLLLAICAHNANLKLLLWLLWQLTQFVVYK